MTASIFVAGTSVATKKNSRERRALPRVFLSSFVLRFSERVFVSDGEHDVGLLFRLGLFSVDVEFGLGRGADVVERHGHSGVIVDSDVRSESDAVEEAYVGLLPGPAGVSPSGFDLEIFVRMDELLRRTAEKGLVLSRENRALNRTLRELRKKNPAK